VRAIGGGVAVSLLIVCPTFLFEESWHGKPLIDRPGVWWVLPAAIILCGLLAGAAIAGTQYRSRREAQVGGVLVNVIVIGLLFVVDIFRRHAVGKYMTPQVGSLWLAAVVGSIFVGLIGGIAGYRISQRPGRGSPQHR
jgi:hypothetical protein